MKAIKVADFEAWRKQARVLLEQGVSPDRVAWIDAASSQQTLPLANETLLHEPGPDAGPSTFHVPRRFVDLARIVALPAQMRCDRSVPRRDRAAGVDVGRQSGQTEPEPCRLDLRHAEVL